MEKMPSPKVRIFVGRHFYFNGERVFLSDNRIIMEEEKQQLDIELEGDIAQGTYANLAIITHSTSEFVLDFVRIMPGLPKANVKSRIILTPEHAKRLLMALQDNIRKFEQMNGKINLPEEKQQTFFPFEMGGGSQGEV